MKHYKDTENNIYTYFDDAFDEEGKPSHSKVIEDISNLKLIKITDEEYAEIQAQKEAERLAEQERLAKLPSQEELEKNRIELVALDLIISMKEEGII